MVNDFETAAWQILQAILGKRETTHLPEVNVQPHRTLILKYFILMGVPLRMDNHRWINEVPVADFSVSPPKKLFPIRVDPADMTALKETLPVLIQAAAHADGTSLIPVTETSSALLKDFPQKEGFFHLEGKKDV